MLHPRSRPGAGSTRMYPARRRMMSTIISSPQNDRVKRVRLLQSHAKARRQHRRLVLEGMRLDYVFFTDPAAELIAPLETAGIECLLVSDELMRDMADTETPQGILGL